jgi:hypothetical protein
MIQERRSQMVDRAGESVGWLFRWRCVYISVNALLHLTELASLIH